MRQVIPRRRVLVTFFRREDGTYRVALLQKEFRQVGSILTRNASNQSNLSSFLFGHFGFFAVSRDPARRWNNGLVLPATDFGFVSLLIRYMV